MGKIAILFGLLGVVAAAAIYWFVMRKEPPPMPVTSLPQQSALRAA